MIILKFTRTAARSEPALSASAGHPITKTTLPQVLGSTTSHRQPREQTTEAMDRAPTRDGSLVLRIEKSIKRQSRRVWQFPAVLNIRQKNPQKNYQ